MNCGGVSIGVYVIISFSRSNAPGIDNDMKREGR